MSQLGISQHYLAIHNIVTGVSTNGESYSFFDDTTAIAIVSTVGGIVIVGIIALAAYFLLCRENTLAAR